MEMHMKTTLMKTLVALGLVSALAVTAATSSLAQRNCIQQYDSSGAPTGPYC
jgi:hypothetical protein